MPGLVFSDTNDESVNREVRRRADSGELRRITASIYTDDLARPVEDIVRARALEILGRLQPGAVISARSAANPMPIRAIDAAGQRVGPGYVFLSKPGSRRSFSLPGLEVRMAPGPGPLLGDNPLMGLYLASPARHLLENLTPSRERGGPARTLGAKGVEELLLSMCRKEGEDRLNEIRDHARQLAPQLGLEAEFKTLEGLIGTLLRTRQAPLETQEGQARSRGEAYDPECFNRILLLSRYLESVALPSVRDTSASPQNRAATAFIEAYFSNYIEGTQFLIGEAREIVFEGRIPQARPKDGHDISASFAQLVDLGNRAPSSVSYDRFIEELLQRHADLQAARPENNPGKFKQTPNLAGSTVFVRPELVLGTLKVGFQRVTQLDHPFARAILLHFLLTDVHPFDDGNGRISRIMMTKELVTAGLSRIIIPTVYRDDYLGALRSLSRHNEPAPMVRALTFAQNITANISEPTADRAIETWAKTYAFQSPGANARFERPNPATVIEWRDGIPAPADYWANEAANDFGIRI